MQRRLSGFVVGRKELDQTTGWKIARKTRKGRMNYFIPDAEIAKGIKLHSGMDVTFVAELRDGRWFALSVQPKPQTEERSMRKLSIRVLLAALVLALGGIVALASMNEDFMDALNDIHADVSETLAEEFISNDAVRRAVRQAANEYSGLKSVTYTARWAVFEEQFCAPFDEHFPDSAGGGHSACWWGVYSMWDREDDNYWYNRVGIPVDAAPVVESIYTTILEELRAHLQTPANLQAVYNAKIDVVLDEFQRLSTAEKGHLIVYLTEAVAAFTMFRDDADARERYAEYIRLEEAWVASYNDEEADSYAAFQAWEAVREELRTDIPNFQMYLFAGRRHAEGGDELLNAYIGLGADLLGEIGG